jgi:hypothetical protein
VRLALAEELGIAALPSTTEIYPGLMQKADG